MKSYFIKQMMLYLSCFSCLVFAESYDVQDGVFTDSQGQTTKYRIGIPSGYVSGSPGKILVYLHGNASGSQDVMLDRYYSYIETKADARGLIPIVVTSPETRPDGVIRQWNLEKDPQMFDELLKSHIQSKIKVDFEHVYLFGESHGGCFINAFLLAKPDEYLGGALGHCGCFNFLDNSYDPGERFKENYRFYIVATTEDHLYEPSVNGYEFYRWTAGLKNVRGDFSRPGGHCKTDNAVLDSALDWITKEIEIPQSPDEIHWQRISTFDSVSSLAVGSENELIAGVSNGNNGNVYVSHNQGDSWSKMLTLNGEKVLSVVGGKNGEVHVLTGVNHYHYNSKFDELSKELSKHTDFQKDGEGNLYKIGGFARTEVSLNEGDTWLNIGSGITQRATNGLEFVDSSSSAILVNSTWRNYFMIDKDGNEQNIQLPNQSLTRFNFSTHNGTILLYGIDTEDSWRPYIFTTTDLGVTWKTIAPPEELTNHFIGFGVHLYHDGSIFFHGPGVKRSFDDGKTWQSEKNLNNLGEPVFVIDMEGIAYVSGGKGVFRRQAWLTEEDRPKHTKDGETTTSTLNKSQVLNKSHFQKIGELIVVNGSQNVSAKWMNVKGESYSLPILKNQNKFVIDTRGVASGSIIQIDAGLGNKVQILK